MAPLTFASIDAIPLLLQLVVGLLGLIFSIKARSRGGSGLMVGAFAVLLVTTAGALTWQFVSLNVASWTESSHLTGDDIQLIFMGVDLPLNAAVALSWLLVAIAVVKGGRPAQQPGFAPYPGPAPYPMGTQPGFTGPQPGYAQPGYPQPQPQSQPPAQQPPS